MGDHDVGGVVRSDEAMTAIPAPGSDPTSIIRDSFAGINARFHLAGAYTLIDLLLRILLTVLQEDPERFGGLIMLAMVLAVGAVFGILGATYHAAAGRPGTPSLVRYVGLLFIPLVWLQIKLEILTYAPTMIGLWSLHGIAAPEASQQEWLANATYWVAPFAGLAVLILSLYSRPLCIYHREQRVKGMPIRDGLKQFRLHPYESRRLLILVLLIGVLRGAVHYMHGPETGDLVPDIPEGLVLFATSYLNLVVFFGATRVVLAGRPQASPAAGEALGPRLPGPPA